MAYFPRHLERIVKTASKQFSSILVTGARQVGKTTLLQHLYPNLPYISMDDPVILELGERDPNRLLKMNSLPMIIDEVQYAPSLFPYFKITIDRTKQKGLFYITGSQQFHMMKHVSESLAGRVAIVNLYGLSLREIQKISFSQPFLPTNGYFTKREETLKEISYRQIWRLIQQGCMPSMYSHDTTWKLFYSSYTRTYI